MDTPIKTGLVGYGLGGKCFHAPFIAANPHYELVSVVERNKSESLERYPGSTVVRSIEALLKDETIALVVITTPNDTHFSYAQEALQAGKHVVVDKPMTVTSAQAAQLIEQAKRQQKILSVYQSRRYASDALTIKKLLERDLLGRIHEFEAQYNRYRPESRSSWKETTVPGSGILYDLGPHLLDQALYFFGLPQTITADVRIQRPLTKAIDYFDIRLDYDFTRVILKAGMLVREQGPRYMIHGTRGSFIKYGDDPQDADARSGKLPTDPNWGREPEEHYGLLHAEVNGAVIRERIPSEKGDFGIFYQNLYETLVHGAPLKEKPEHGFNAVRLIELALESQRQQRSLPCTGMIQIDY